MTTHALRLTSPPDDVNRVHVFLEEIWEVSSVEPMDRFRFETALIELASNVLRHAAGGQLINCTMTIKVSNGDLAAELIDDGQAGDIELDTAMPDEFAESGRGIPLIRALVDTVDYSRCEGSNRWIIAKRLGA